ncbi:hypothetical protein FQA39_LY07846 [Lamprigera yunnana]|nr:hypothetical protein FQA39_LY07846 [Lamprigera yunnana]
MAPILSHNPERRWPQKAKKIRPWLPEKYVQPGKENAPVIYITRREVTPTREETPERQPPVDIPPTPRTPECMKIKRNPNAEGAKRTRRPPIKIRNDAYSPLPKRSAADAQNAKTLESREAATRHSTRARKQPVRYRRAGGTKTEEAPRSRQTLYLGHGLRALESGSWKTLCSKLLVTPAKVKLAVESLTDEQLKRAVAVKQIPSLIKLGLITKSIVDDVEGWADQAELEEDFLKNLAASERTWLKSVPEGIPVDKANDLAGTTSLPVPWMVRRHTPLVITVSPHCFLLKKTRHTFQKIHRRNCRLPCFQGTSGLRNPSEGSGHIGPASHKPPFRSQQSSRYTCGCGYGGREDQMEKVLPPVVRRRKQSRHRDPFADQRKAVPEHCDFTMIDGIRFHLVADVVALCKRASSSEEERAALMGSDMCHHVLRRASDR